MAEALLMAALPTDDESRTFPNRYTPYAILAVNDPTLAAQPFIGNPDAAEDALTELLRQAQEAALLEPGVDRGWRQPACLPCLRDSAPVSSSASEARSPRPPC